MADPFDIGDCVRATATFTNSSGVVADPTAVAVSFLDPEGVKTIVSGGSVVKDSTGVYHVDIVPEKAGVYWVRFDGTGAVIAAEEVQFTVRSKRVQ